MTHISKPMKYCFAVLLFIFYGYIAFTAGIAVAIVLFLKMLGLTLFYMSHIWTVDLLEGVGKIKWSKLWSSISLPEFLRRSQ